MPNNNVFRGSDATLVLAVDDNSTAEGSLVGQVAAYSNIKIELHPLDTPRLSDVYAKVLAVSPTEAGTSHVRLELTSLPEGAKAFLAAIEQSAPLPS